MNCKICLVEVHLIRRSSEGIEFLLMKRAPYEKYPGIWQMVTGHVEQNEMAKDAALREAKEETGAEITNLWSIPHVNSYFDPFKDIVCNIPVFVIEVEKSFMPKLSVEHDEYKWVQKEEAQALVAWPGQRKSIEIIEEYFSEERSEMFFLKIL